MGQIDPSARRIEDAISGEGAPPESGEPRTSVPLPPPPVSGPQVVYVTAPSNGMAVASLVLGIVSIVLTFAGTLPAILAIVFGAIGRGRAVPGHGKALATWGLALGIVGLVLSVVILAMIDAGGGL